MQTKCHLSVLIREQAKKYGDREALVYKDFGSTEWKSVSWRKFYDTVRQVSGALLSIGVEPQENVGVFSQNSAHYICSDFGIYGVRAVSVPLYATSSEQQIQYIINDAKIRLLFVGEQEQYDKAHRVCTLCHTLRRIVVFDRNVHLSQHDPYTLFFDEFLKLSGNGAFNDKIDERYREANDDDLANILYTSGTTGESKGVILTHGQFRAALDANDKVVHVNEDDRVLNFLPFAHVFEKGWAIFSLTQGATMIVNNDPKEVLQTMHQTHPTSMSAVPRFWEKVYAAVMEKIDKASHVERSVFMNALAVGKKHNIDYISRGKRPPMPLHLEYELINRTVFSMVRRELGIPHPHLFPTAGATVSPHVEEFVHSVGLSMIVGYGLTESLATVTCDRLDEGFSIGSVGKPLPGLDIKISDEGEILLKGPTITKGYYNRPDLNDASFTADGYFRTGDAGYIKEGELYLTERIKDLFKTSNGKYIAPQMIESKLLVDRYIDQIAVIADERKFVSALIVPDFRVLEEYARQHNLLYTSREDLCQNPQVHIMMMERIETLQQQLAHYEKIKRITLLPHHFSMETGELTDTLKLKRRVISQNYKREIDQMYEE